MKKPFNQILKAITLAVVVAQLQGCAAAVIAGAAGGGYLIAQDRRSNGTMMDDQSVEVKARQEIVKLNKLEKRSHVEMISYNNNVLLVGQVLTQAHRDNIEQAVKRIEKVRLVHNEITVSQPTSTSVRTNDAWITTKVKARMLAERELNSNRIKVITENGVVYLLGIIKPDEEKLATLVTREVKGVKKVVKMFEFMAIE